LIYANKQNIDRQKASVRQETIFITNMVLNNSTTTNVLICKRIFPGRKFFLIFYLSAPNDQCLSMYELPKIKRERISYQYIEKENYDFYDQPQVPFNTNFNNNILTSPTQEMGHIDEFFNWLDGENNKSTNHAINDTYGINYVPDFGFLTPTISEINFF
jgi:hypothetical protein